MTTFAMLPVLFLTCIDNNNIPDPDQTVIDQPTFEEAGIGVQDSRDIKTLRLLTSTPTTSISFFRT